MTAISPERWAEAQEGETAFWTSADRTELCRYLDGLYTAFLDIRAQKIKGLTVLDIGGGPMPLAVLLELPVKSLTVVDPLPVAVTDPPNVTRHVTPAETYQGALCDEVWGYNVLQHVIDPAAVIATAKAHALTRVRWFDWVDSPIASHHPHSISANWLREQFPADTWRLTVNQAGSVRVPKVQHYVALVAERI